MTSWGFQHLHPTMAASGAWSTRLTRPAAGSPRVFADFKHEERNLTLARTLTVPGPSRPVALPAPASSAVTDGGYTVEEDTGSPRAGSETGVSFDVSRAGRPVAVQAYLGARGHLVALRSTDLAYLHVHPNDAAASSDPGRVAFATTFPSAGRYRLFLQFKHDGRVRTAAFTARVAR